MQLCALLLGDISALWADYLSGAVIETFNASGLRHDACLCQVKAHANTGEAK